MKSLPLAALLVGGIIGGALGASALSAGPMPKMHEVLDGVVPAGWHGGKHGPRHHGHGGHGGPGPMGGMPMMQMAREADTDNDMALTQEEVDAYVAAKVALGDTDGDGNLSLGEFQTVWLSLMRPQMVDRFQELDEDGDGVVTAAERDARFGEIVVRLDRNDDGKVGRSDFRRGRRADHEDRRAAPPAPPAAAPAPAPAPAN